VFRCHGYYENKIILLMVSASHLLGPCTYERKKYISLTVSLSISLDPREKCILFGSSSTKRLMEKRDTTDCLCGLVSNYEVTTVRNLGNKFCGCKLGQYVIFQIIKVIIIIEITSTALIMLYGKN
jgi:hypothetical protein